MINSKDPLVASEGQEAYEKQLKNSPAYRLAKRQHEYYKDSLEINRGYLENIKDIAMETNARNERILAQQREPERIRQQFLDSVDNSKEKHLAEFNALDHDSLTPEQLRAARIIMEQRIAEDTERFFHVKEANLLAIGATLSKGEERTSFYYSKTPLKNVDYERAKQEMEKEVHSEDKEQKEERSEQNQQKEERSEDKSSPNGDSEAEKRKKSL